MFRVIKVDGTELGVTDEVTYIKVGASGSYIDVPADEATGVAFKSEPYNLLGHNEIEGADTVIVSEFDGGNSIYSQQKIVDNLIVSVLEV